VIRFSHPTGPFAGAVNVLYGSASGLSSTGNQLWSQDTLRDAGGVNVLYGSASRLVVAGNQFWTQNSAGIQDTAEVNDRFGAALSAGSFGMSAQADLAIGVSEEDLEGTPSIGDAGAVHLLYGSVTGLSATGSQLWTQNSPNIQSVAGADNFGAALPRSPMFNLLVDFF
jgi:hypothetical protein